MTVIRSIYNKDIFFIVQNEVF